MESAISDLVMLGLYGVVGAAVLGVIVWRIVAMSRAATAPISNEQCVACGSKNVSTMGPGMYRCEKCGYEGGSGVAAAMAEQERAQVQAMSAEARRAAGFADLQQALAGLVAVEQRLQGMALSQEEVDAARTEILEAGEHLRRAGLELGDPLLTPRGQDVDTGALTAGVLRDVIAGQSGIGPNVANMAMTAAEASGLRDQVRAMVGLARAALTRADASMPS